MTTALPHSIAAYLQQHETTDLLRFITCGSVDDGKSTLIGRLLYDTKLLFEDQLTALESDSVRFGTQNGELDFALLVDGLSAEREQGITIDVAYRFFGTERRKFIVADCPGHEQYTRNMATGASTADLAVVLVDARRGLLTQTRRHSYICGLMGIRHVVLAVNKMDLVGYDQQVFETIAAEYRTLAGTLGVPHVHCIPLSALRGDNVIAHSDAMPWYEGPALLPFLETVALAGPHPNPAPQAGEGAPRSHAGDGGHQGGEGLSPPPARGGRPGGGPAPSAAPTDAPFRLPVQWVNRPDQSFRGFAGTITGGRVAVGDEVVSLPSGQRSRVARIVTFDGDLAEAMAGDAVTLTLADEIDASRGDVLAAAKSPPAHADQFAVHLLWMGEQPLLPGRPYWLRIGTRTVSAQVTEIKHRVDVNTQEHLAAKRLDLNEVAYCNLNTDQPVVFEPFADEKALGAFILIDRQSNATVACGTIDFALRRASNVHWQHLDINKQARARIKGQKPACLWFTGLSGSGKSTIANLVDKRLHAMGYHTYILDGDNVRHGLNKDLGFTDEDRVENIRRVAEVARLMVDAGLIVLVSFISPFRSERRMARAMFADGEFFEIFVDTPLEVCEQRDVKGLYARARRGEIPNFTGVTAPYELPEHTDLRLDGAHTTPDTEAENVLSLLGLD